jgi:hypothetical protein
MGPKAKKTAKEAAAEADAEEDEKVKRRINPEDDRFPVERFLIWRFMVTKNFGWTVNTLLATILWSIYAFPVLLVHGYSDQNFGVHGNIPSGPSGSGGVLIMSAIWAGASCVYMSKFVSDRRPPFGRTKTYCASPLSMHKLPCITESSRYAEFAVFDAMR